MSITPPQKVEFNTLLEKWKKSTCLDIGDVLGMTGNGVYVPERHSSTERYSGEAFNKKNPKNVHLIKTFPGICRVIYKIKSIK